MSITAIETPRLTLRPFTMAMLDDLHRLWTDPHVRRFLFDDEIIPREQVEAEIITSMQLFKERGHGLWSVSLKGREDLIGFCGYRFFHEPPELQLLYGVAPDHWAKGIATEAAKAMIRYGFQELGMSRIVASADAPNEASFRVMEKAGMKFDCREVINELDTIYYSLSRESFTPDEEITILRQ